MLRGFALLGILAMNIVAFGFPGVAYGNPMRGGGFEGFDRVVWYFNHLFFEMKMMTIFSMLFGAGLVLMDQRAEARGARIRGRLFSTRALAAGDRLRTRVSDLERRHPGALRRVRALPLLLPEPDFTDPDHPGNPGSLLSCADSPGDHRRR